MQGRERLPPGSKGSRVSAREKCRQSKFRTQESLGKPPLYSYTYKVPGVTVHGRCQKSGSYIYMGNQTNRSRADYAGSTSSPPTNLIAFEILSRVEVGNF